MSTSDLEASKSFTKVWIECLSNSTRNTCFRWSIIQQAFKQVPSLLSYIPNTALALSKCTKVIKDRLDENEINTNLACEAPSLFLASWCPILFGEGFLERLLDDTE